MNNWALPQSGSAENKNNAFNYSYIHLLLVLRVCKLNFVANMIKDCRRIWKVLVLAPFWKAPTKGEASVKYERISRNSAFVWHLTTILIIFFLSNVIGYGDWLCWLIVNQQFPEENNYSPSSV